MDEILNNKNVLSHILTYLEISDFLNLELTNTKIKNCIDFYYETKNILYDYNKSERLSNERPIRKDSKINKLNLTKCKKNYISKYLNSFVVFNINEEFNEEEIPNEKNPLKNEIPELKNITNAKFIKNCFLSKNSKCLNYFFDTE